MSELAERLRVARRSATSLVDELVERGLVERLADPSDRRAVTVAVTAAGAAVLERLAERRREAASDLASALDRRELRTLRDLLRRLDAPGGQ
jgi:DNA-binding MarR family transcriptional regulator